LLEAHGAEILYCPALSRFRWDTRRWLFDELEAVDRLVEEVVRDIHIELRNEQDPDRQKELLKLIQSQSRAQRLHGSLTIAQRHVAVAAEQLDSHCYFLNVLNGTLDLRTGILQPHHKEDLVTKLIPIDYDLAAKAARWYRFLSEIFDGDLELSEYVKRAVGYSLTGDQREKAFWFLWGPRDTGKTTFTNTLLHLTGEYGQQAPATLFLRNRDSIPADEARLRGMRFVLASETDDGQHFDEGKLKKLTGRNRITARTLYGKWFEFDPLHHLWLESNYRPHAKSDDGALWGRLKLIPFTVVFEDDEDALHRMDRQLEAALLQELPGILAWAVEGAREWYQSGLVEPDKVKVATKEYQAAEDVIAAFIRDRIELKQNSSAKTSAVWKSYQDYTEGEKRLGKQHFNRALKDIYDFILSETGREWRHIRLVNSDIDGAG
jgi:putative DNA primase/helicase